MTPNRSPLHHIVRIRQSDDLTFVRAGLMDEVLVNANQLENSPDSTATALRETTLPFSVDPVLWRFQVPTWWWNERGETKKNYSRLGAAYVKGTNIHIAAGPLRETVPSDEEWRIVADNVVDYQRHRLSRMPTQLDLLGAQHPRQLAPVRLLSPALVAFSAVEDRINRLLVEATATAATVPAAVPVIVPLERLRVRQQVDQLLATVRGDGVSSYFLWTPGVTEELLLNDRDVFAAVLHLLASLADRGVAVGHLHATYGIAALHDVGIPAVVHHLGWVDKGEPAAPSRGGLRSCQTYVPGVRHCARFDQADRLGGHLAAAAYTERYCECAFCSGSFANGEHPLDLLLKDRLVPFENGRDRRTPTGSAVVLNTWHYLLSRRLEIEAFSGQPATEVIDRDTERAAALAGARNTARLRRLASELSSA